MIDKPDGAPVGRGAAIGRNFDESGRNEHTGVLCAECGKPIEEGDASRKAISTYCGSLHGGCRADHIDTCGVCAGDI